MPESNSVAAISSENYLTSLKGLSRVVEPPILKQVLGNLPNLSTLASSPRIPLEGLLELHGRMADRYADPLLMVRAYSSLNYEPQFIARTFVAGSLTAGDALALLCRYIKVCTDLCAIRLSAGPGLASLRIEPNRAHPAARELVDATVYSLTRILLGLGMSRISVIKLNHTPTVAIQEQYRAFFPGPIQFGSNELAIEFPVEDVFRHLHWTTDSAEKLAKRERRFNRLQPEPKWQESIDILLPLLSLLGEANIDQCASLLAVSRRSLQRHIRVEGFTFRDLLERNRRQLSAKYLSRGYANDEIASLLGYRQSGQFYRAFRGWYGCSPTEYRLQSPIYPSPIAGTE